MVLLKQNDFATDYIAVYSQTQAVKHLAGQIHMIYINLVASYSFID